MKPRILALLAAMALSACGTAADDPLLGAARGLASDVFTRDEPTAPTVGPRQVLTRDIINQAGLPLILVESQTGSSLTMVRIGSNGANGTWQGDGGATITLSREGVLRATRGAGPDLYSSDISQTRAALTSGRSGVVERLYVYVGGDLEEQRIGYSCDIARHGSERIDIFGQSRTLTRVTETCSRHPDGGHVFENRFWVDGSGLAWVSEQWVSAELGHFRIERLHR